MARKQFSNEFKTKVALEALKGEKTIAQLSSEYGVHASQINPWKQQVREKRPELFGRPSGLDEQRHRKRSKTGSTNRLVACKWREWTGCKKSPKRWA